MLINGLGTAQKNRIRHRYVIVAKENSTLATGPAIFILDKYYRYKKEGAIEQD